MDKIYVDTVRLLLEPLHEESVAPLSSRDFVDGPHLESNCGLQVRFSGLSELLCGLSNGHTDGIHAQGFSRPQIGG